MLIVKETASQNAPDAGFDSRYIFFSEILMEIIIHIHEATYLISCQIMSELRFSVIWIIVFIS